MGNTLHIWCDGACSGNPGPGGYASAIIRDDNKIEYISGFSERTTNNRMELMAFINALNLALLNKTNYVVIHTDSKYVENAINCKWLFNWAKKDFNKIKNPDLWIKVYDVISECDFISVEWVKGHSGVFENELVDRLANESMVLRRTSHGIIEI